MALVLDSQTIQQTQQQSITDLLDQLASLATAVRDVHERKRSLFEEQQTLYEQRQLLLHQRQALSHEESILLQEKKAILGQLSKPRKGCA